MRSNAEMIPELPHDLDVGTAETEDRLPVVADREQLCASGAVEQRFQQPRPGPRTSWNSSTSILEWALVAPGLYQIVARLIMVKVNLPGAVSVSR